MMKKIYISIRGHIFLWMILSYFITLSGCRGFVDCSLKLVIMCESQIENILLTGFHHFFFIKKVHM